MYSNYSYALLSLHPVAAACCFNYRPYRRIFIELRAYALPLGARRCTRHTGYQPLLRGKASPSNDARAQKKQVLIPVVTNRGIIFIRYCKSAYFFIFII